MSFQPEQIQEQQNSERARPSELLAKLLFLSNFMTFMAICDHTELFKPVQLGFACVSLVITAFNRFGSETLGETLVVVVTISLHLLPIATASHYMLYVPVLYLLDCPGVRAKTTTILNVTIQTIWMLVSVAVCSYVFGGASYEIYTRNNPHFNDQKMASMVFVQLATLDDMGKISKENLTDRGIIAAMATALAVLFFAHGLFNTNTAFVLAYISDEHRQHKELLDVNRNLIGESIPLLWRVMRLLNIVCSIWVLFDPYNTNSAGLYTLTAIASASLVQYSEYLEDRVKWYRSLINHGLTLMVLTSYLSDWYTLLYMTMTLRIVLIPEVKDNFRKVYKSLFEASSFLLIGLAFFLIYAFGMNAFNQNRSIYIEIIEALQLACLDQQGRILHEVKWFIALVMIAFMVFFNHLIMNIVVAQLFNAIERADILQRVTESKMKSRTLSEVQDEIEAAEERRVEQREAESHHHIPWGLDEAQQFGELMKELGYKPLHRQ